MKRQADSALILASLITLLGCIAAEWVMPQTHEPPVPEPTVQVLATRDRSIASYDVKERQLVVSEHAPRETLICMRNRCKLVEEWTEAK